MVAVTGATTEKENRSSVFIHTKLMVSFLKSANKNNIILKLRTPDVVKIKRQV